MNDSDIDRIAGWLIERGLVGTSEPDLLNGFCEQACAAGLPVVRAMALVDTLHPVYEGRAFRWRNDGVEESAVLEYGSSSEGQAAANWLGSSFYHLWSTSTNEVRRRIGLGDPTDFVTLETLKAEGHTDYVAFINRFAGAGIIGEMDCVYTSWTTTRPEGF